MEFAFTGLDPERELLIRKAVSEVAPPNAHEILSKSHTEYLSGLDGIITLNLPCLPDCQVATLRALGRRIDPATQITYQYVLGLSQIPPTVLPKLVTVCPYIAQYMTDTFRVTIKGFRCACARCESTSKNANAEKTLTGWRCADSLCVGVAAHDAFATTEDESPLEDLLICSTCLSGTAVGGVSKRDATGAETRWRTAIDKSREFGRNGDHAESSKIASDTLAECANSLHKDHVVQHELRLALTAASVKLGDWRVVANTARATVVSMAKGSHPGLADARNTLADALERIYGDEGDTQGDKSDLLEEALVNRTAMCEALRVAYGDEHDATKKAVAKRDVLEGKRRTEK